METMTMAITPTKPSEAMRTKVSHSLMNPLLRKHTATPPVSDRQERTSFASFKEDRNAVAQSFIDTKISSYARAPEEAIDDSASEESNFDTDGHQPYIFNAPMALTSPCSMLNTFICPCEGVRGWKQIAVGGRAASRSFSDLRILSKGFSWELPASKQTPETKPRNEAGQSFLESLPVELLGIYHPNLMSKT
jgi:hypothetical protein